MTNVTLTAEQAQQIEEALEDIVRVFEFETGTPVEALATIRAARAQEQAEQEPVAWRYKYEGMWLFSEDYCAEHPFEQTPLYAAPVRTKDLTDDEIVSVLEYYDHEWDETTFAIARAVIAADRELNK